MSNNQTESLPYIHSEAAQALLALGYEADETVHKIGETPSRMVRQWSYGGTTYLMYLVVGTNRVYTVELASEGSSEREMVHWDLDHRNPLNVPSALVDMGYHIASDDDKCPYQVRIFEGVNNPWLIKLAMDGDRVTTEVVGIELTDHAWRNDAGCNVQNLEAWVDGDSEPVVKPPLGATPRHIHEANTAIVRINELLAAS